MEEPGSPAGAQLIRGTTPREVFTELVTGALGGVRVPPTPLAVAYLIELLDQRVRVPEPAGLGPGEESTLAEGLLAARLEQGAARLRRLRSLGDRALFISGFFGDSLDRSAVDLDYYGEAGRAAYADVARGLSIRLREKAWPGLFEELAERFCDFVEVLTEVSERTRVQRPLGLLRLYERYLRTGSDRDRRRLLSRGCVPLDPSVMRFWQ